MIAPSGMMDGQIAAIRAALDTTGNTRTAILAYAANILQVFMALFRDAAGCSLGQGAGPKTVKRIKWTPPIPTKPFVKSTGYPTRGRYGDG